MKYTGKRTNIGAVVLVERDRGANSMLPPRADLRNHSPDGFEWGYAGSGPAQLSLAICAHAINNDARAQRVYQHFKARVVQHWKENAWEISRERVLEIVEQIESEKQEPIV